MVVGGVSYSTKLKQHSLTSAPDGQKHTNRLAISGEHLNGQMADEDQNTPRGAKVDIKTSKFSGKTKFGSSIQKKDMRVS